MPFASGKVDPAEAGKKGAEARWGAPKGAEAEGQEEAAESLGGFDLLNEMEGLLQRPASRDRGEAQKGLRKWYDADPKAFMGQLAGLKREKMRAAGKASGREAAGSSASAQPDAEEYAEYLAWKKRCEEERNIPADELLDRLLYDANVYARIGTAVADKWEGLSIQQRRTILDTAGIAYTFEVNPGTKDTPTLSLLTRHGTVDGARQKAGPGEQGD